MKLLKFRTVKQKVTLELQTNRSKVEMKNNEGKEMQPYT